VQPHDDEPNSENRKDNYFVPPHFYCVETICAPCGVVHAWALFDKVESPTNILNFLEAVFPTPDWKPGYVLRAVRSFVLLLAIDHGMFGKRELDS
jgi:hypothetical protein